ncbi:snRNA-activating protein complex subunit 2 isoform X1 [Syngnathus acus]|uniref:snRNA-activating protein complex subunit 2 isoform X1 n=1 Tax=Syngnathus acus TaxID=161584 RepID=UPI00188633DA|nr:snRNA-activating protein complex subunit 2 isoform X1 [Syngnathus acus]
MKPPPRTRKPVRNLNPDPKPCRTKRACAWSRKEQRRLLDALTRQSSSRDGGTLENIDYSLLKKDVPSRSDCEIRSVVERLQNKVISGAILQLKTRTLAEKKAMVPIQMWTRLAQAVSGSFNGPLCKAFAQMWTVASTEPHTLRNSQLPQLDAAMSNDRTVCLSAAVGPTPAEVLVKSPAAASAGPTASPAVPVEQPSLSSPTTSEDFAVDFERIYNYLSGLHKSEDECELTAMESAVVLDLVMSLPEELSLLPCQSLHRHLIQVESLLQEDQHRGDRPLTNCSPALRSAGPPELVRSKALREGATSSDGASEAAARKRSRASTKRHKRRRRGNIVEWRTKVDGTLSPSQPIHDSNGTAEEKIGLHIAFRHTTFPLGVNSHLY